LAEMRIGNYDCYGQLKALLNSFISRLNS